MRILELMRDCPMRWSSTYLMLDRVLELYPAIEVLLLKPEHIDLSGNLISPKGLEALSDIHQLLRIFYRVQQIVSAELTPTLSFVLPLYNQVVRILKGSYSQVPKISHAITAALHKLENYLMIARDIKIHNIAVVLNARTKFEWLKGEAGEETDAYRATKAVIREHMMLYKQYMCTSNQSQTAQNLNCQSSHSTPHSTPTSVSGLDDLEYEFARRTRWPQTVDLYESHQERKARWRREVDSELMLWEADGIIGRSHPEYEDFDLLRFWQSKRRRYPTLWRVALDILPMQASAVPSERVFSSSKETDTERRSLLSPVKFEVLQILKYRTRRNRLNFVKNLIMTEAELMSWNYEVECENEGSAGDRPALT